MSCTPCTPPQDEFPIFCDPNPATDVGQRLLVEDEAFCTKALVIPETGSTLVWEDGIKWKDGDNTSVLKKSSSGVVEFGKVETDYIADSAITTVKIDNGNVTTAKIADNSITTAKLVDSSITTAKIADSSVTTAKISDSSITTAKIADSSVTTAKIADSSVTTAKINNASVTPSKLSETYLKTSDFTGTNQSKTGDGWQVLPGGLIIQWGSSNSATEVIFPKVFPNSVLSFTATPIQGSPIQATVQLDSTWNVSPTTKVNIYKTGGLSTMSFTWIAIGW